MPSQIFGHEKQRGLLKKQILNKRLTNPVILYGPDGIGKSLVVREILENFKAEKIRVDCTEFKPESKKGGYTLEQIHAFTSEIKIKPFDGTIRAFIFDDAHRFMTVHANALLKTLEELSAGFIVFFITHNLYHVLPTIRSRCTQICFHPLDDQLLCQILNKSLEKHTLKRVCGSVKKAILFTDSDFLSVQNLLMQAIAALYSKRFDQLNKLLDQIQKALKDKSKDWLEYLLESLLYFQLDRIRLKHDIDDFVFPENKPVLQKLSHLDYPNIEILQDKLSKLLTSIEMGMSVKYILEQGLFAMY